MRRRDHHGHAGLADLDAAQPVHHGDAADRVRGGDLAADLRHHLDGHRLVALVFEIARGPALGVVARHALEVDEGPVLAAQQAPRERGAIHRIARQGEEIARPGRRSHACTRRTRRSPAAGTPPRRLRPAAQRRRKLLIQRQHDASRHLPQARKPGRVMLENELQPAARGKVQRVLAEADDIAEHTEKKTRIRTLLS